MNPNETGEINVLLPLIFGGVLIVLAILAAVGTWALVKIGVIEVKNRSKLLSVVLGAVLIVVGVAVIGTLISVVGKMVGYLFG